MKKILLALQEGKISLEEAQSSIQGELDLGGIKLDTDRVRRTGLPEVIYGEGKSREQLRSILTALAPPASPMVTRLDAELGLAMAEEFPHLTWYPQAKILKGEGQPPQYKRTVAILSAGASDQPIAEEAAICLEHLGASVDRYYDVGVAGPHRLARRLEEVRTSGVAIVVAGMDGALPSFAGGLIDLPLIAVPTSVGYGASFQGIAPLLTMLNSCSSGVVVVNIDNGYGAAMAALRILQQEKRPD